MSIRNEREKRITTPGDCGGGRLQSRCSAREWAAGTVPNSNRGGGGKGESVDRYNQVKRTNFFFFFLANPGIAQRPLWRLDTTAMISAGSSSLDLILVHFILWRSRVASSQTVVNPTWPPFHLNALVPPSVIAFYSFRRRPDRSVFIKRKVSIVQSKVERRSCQKFYF